jgi:hypothetical protein
MAEQVIKEIVEKYFWQFMLFEETMSESAEKRWETAFAGFLIYSPT